MTTKSNAILNVRTTEEVKARLRALAEALSREHGTRFTQTQALEVAITEACGRHNAAALAVEYAEDV